MGHDANGLGFNSQSIDGGGKCSYSVLMIIETLGDAYTHSITAVLACAEGKGSGMKRQRECIFRQELDTMTLLCTRGRDFPIGLLSTVMRCPRCGSRKVRLMWDLPGNGDRRREGARPR